MTEINDYISTDLKPFSNSDSIATAKDFFASELFSHFPVLDEKIYIGSISGDDVETFDDDKQLSHYRYAMEGFFARTNMVWLEVLAVFARNNTNVLPVLDDANAYVGYYEVADILKMINDTPFLKEEGGTIIVEKPIDDYSFGQIVQIIESNNGKILGLFLSEMRADAVQVTIKIALGGMNEIIQTFRRYGYEIISEHQEDTYLNNLKDRSDYLDKYLNI